MCRGGLYHSAAAQNRKPRDLVSDGLRTVLDSPVTAVDGDEEVRTVLTALDDMLRCPPLPVGRVAGLHSDVLLLRDEGWSRGDL